MSGTIEGGLKTRQTNITKYGEDYYHKLGKMGGQAGTGHKFAHGKVKPSVAGKLGGRPKGSVGIAKRHRPAETFFVADAQIDNHIIEPFNKQPFFKGWFKRSK